MVRTFHTTQGRFQAFTSAIKPRDYVAIEFGSNDEGEFATSNGKDDRPELRREVCWLSTSTKNEMNTVYAYHGYIILAGPNCAENEVDFISSSEPPSNMYATADL
jgi:hypothetical protein